MGIVGSNDKKKEKVKRFYQARQDGRNQSRINLMVFSSMITDQTQLGLLQEPSEGKVGNQKGSARQILDSIVGPREKAQHFPHCFV